MNSFWERHPALYCSAAATTGLLYAFTSSLACLLPAVLILFSLTRCRRIPFLLILSAAWLCGHAGYRFPEIPPEGVKGTLLFTPYSLSTSQSHFGSSWVYQGTGKRFDPVDPGLNTSDALNIPCTIQVPLKYRKERPQANISYLISGTLRQSQWGSYFFIPSPDYDWKGTSASFSLAEQRYHWKYVVKTWIYGKIKDPECAEFLAGMVTGAFEDRAMRAEFGKLGLTHLMAISGFHFALVAAMASFILQRLFPRRFSIPLLITALTLYCFFLGFSPSVMRAWIMSVAAIASTSLEKSNFPLNALGVGVLLLLMAYPPIVLNLGFQFSAVSTASILFCYPVANGAIEKALRIRRKDEVAGMSRTDQHLYLVLMLFRDAASLALAVNAAALPFSLYYFGKFPLLSLVYNLFIPFFAGVAIFLLMGAALLSFPLPSLAAACFTVCNQFTRYILDAVYEAPVSLNYMLRLPLFPAWLLALYLTLLLLTAAFLKTRQQNDPAQAFDKSWA